jgi:hypothetical protein
MKEGRGSKRLKIIFTSSDGVTKFEMPENEVEMR